VSDSSSALKVQYRSSRREVWDWYWWSWRQPKGLWRFHVAIAVIGFAGMLVGRPRQNGIAAADIVWAVAAALVLVAWMPLWPLIRFKSQPRTLEVDPAGVRTVIGKLKGGRRWDEIAEIHDRNGTIYIVAKNRNAFIVPARAFASEAVRASFLDSARRWHQACPGRRLQPPY
jgi:hypothetical protein